MSGRQDWGFERVNVAVDGGYVVRATGMRGRGWDGVGWSGRVLDAGRDRNGFGNLLELAISFHPGFNKLYCSPPNATNLFILFRFSFVVAIHQHRNPRSPPGL